MTAGPLVRSVSGTWHRMASQSFDTHEATTQCRKLVKISKVLAAWDGRVWPGVRICTDCRWHG